MHHYANDSTIVKAVCQSSDGHVNLALIFKRIKDTSERG